MPLSLLCPRCDHRFSVSDDLAGMTARCPQCDGTVQVPASSRLDQLPGGEPRPPGLIGDLLDELESEREPETAVPGVALFRPPAADLWGLPVAVWAALLAAAIGAVAGVGITMAVLGYVANREDSSSACRRRLNEIVSVPSEI